MSSPNREITERAFAALERRDVEGFLQFIDPEVEFTSLIAEAEGQTFHGHEGVRDWWQSVAQSIGGLGFDLERYEDMGDEALTTILVTGEIGGSAVSQRMFQRIRMREGKAVEWRFYRTREEALSAKD